MASDPMESTTAVRSARSSTMRSYVDRHPGGGAEMVGDTALAAEVGDAALAAEPFAALLRGAADSSVAAVFGGRPRFFCGSPLAAACSDATGPTMAARVRTIAPESG